jgi:adenine specific DNA methylase Mod
LCGNRGAGHLLEHFAGRVKLIYIDPPFATGQDFSFKIEVGDEELTKQPSLIEEKAYRDTWGRGINLLADEAGSIGTDARNLGG